MASAILIDTTKCIGCRSCQVSCKQWNELPAEHTSLPAGELGLQNPKRLSSSTYVVITHHELDDAKAPGGFRSVFAKRQCMHCEEPACAAACPVTAMHKTDEGPVVYDKSKCIGCRYCMWACPWSVPTADWSSLAPKISKCTMCFDRTKQASPEQRNGQTLTADEKKRSLDANAAPSCVKQCPAGALKFGEREALLAEAKKRIKNNPEKYVDHIYGEKEAGGTNTFYLSPVPFDQIGFPEVQKEPLPKLSAIALGSVPPAVVGVGALLGGAYAINKRCEDVAKEAAAEAARKAEKAAAKKAAQREHHQEFAPVSGNIWTPANKLLMALMGFGALSFLVRFALGLGASTNLSDTWAWGLWIVFDFIWIAVAAGAFATAGLIYIFRREDLYSIGRSAVLMGFLSYTFVVVTLLADLGLPWHFYALALNAPKHSAMFEVSWCVGLYVSILALEFLPVVFEQFGLKQYADMWKKYAPMYVAFAISAFVYLLSRNFLWTGLALVVFSTLAYLFRPKDGEKPVPIMLAIAAVTFSTMHQSSLGSLFLLMPDKLNHLWWSPIMPICYFLSSVAAGTAMMVLIEMWIAKAFKRRLRIQQLAALGKVAFWAMLVYQVVRLGDVAFRGQLPNISGKGGWMFVVEIVLGGLVPIVMLGSAKLRENPRTLAIATGLATLGVVWNRMMGVVFAMTLKGAMPLNAPQKYFPSVFEWGISIGLVAATIFLFGMGAKFLPVLPKEEATAQATVTGD